MFHLFFFKKNEVAGTSLQTVSHESGIFLVEKRFNLEIASATPYVGFARREMKKRDKDKSKLKNKPLNALFALWSILTNFLQKKLFHSTYIMCIM
mmetsp:Transcript_36317/g.54209  ORF Transcript_36317/g.54209 Transcript_36317/m.54209 type:complete len:95 (+) Transcript_36317:517-801(+)